MNHLSVKAALSLAGLLAALLLCACSDGLDEMARTQARGGAYRLAVDSYRRHLAEEKPGKKKAAAVHYEIGTLLVKDNRKEEALAEFRKAAEGGYAQDRIRAALRELVGELPTTNLPATRELLKGYRGFNDDFTEYADMQLLRLQHQEETALRLVAEAAESIAVARFDDAREKLSRARTIAPGVRLEGLADFQRDLPSLEANYAYEQDLKAAHHAFDQTRKVPAGARFTVKAYDEFKRLEKIDKENLREIEDAIKYKALGNGPVERKANESVPGMRYQDFLTWKYALKFTAALPAYDQARGGFDISAVYEIPPCNGLKLTFPVIETPPDGAEALSSAKEAVLVEIAVTIVPKNVSRKLGRELIAPGCEVLSGRATLAGKTVHIPKKPVPVIRQ